MFRYMRYREGTKEVEVVEDGTPYHEAPIGIIEEQVWSADRSNNIHRRGIALMGGLSAYLFQKFSPSSLNGT